MKSFNIIYLLLGIVLQLTCFNSVVFAEKKTTKNEICESYISISGASNINRFHLENHLFDFDFLKFYRSLSHPEQQQNFNTVKIPVKEFRCKNKYMYNDFQELLKAPEYPFIDVSIQAKETLDLKNDHFLTNVTISLAGVKQNFVLSCKVESCGNSVYLLKGEKQINLSDFNIEAPEKLFGTIKVKDEVFINFVFKSRFEDI